MYDVIIIGAGIAGLTSAIYALRANKKVLVLDKKSYGGQIINTLNVENYPGFSNISGYDLMTNIYEQVKLLGGEVKYEEVINIDKYKNITTNKNNYSTKSIIIATGLISRKLNQKDEKRLLGKGISYCATCDGNFYKNLNVMVVGGGNTAMKDAIYLSDICKKVYLVHRRKEFRGEDSYLDIIKKKSNIEIVYNSTIKKINGIEKLESVDLVDEDGKINNILVSGLFITIGMVPNKVFDIIDVDDRGYIKTNESLKTNIDGIYVAGDCRKKKLRQLVTAASDGAVAATEVIRYLNKIE